MHEWDEWEKGWIVEKWQMDAYKNGWMVAYNDP